MFGMDSFEFDAIMNRHLFETTVMASGYLTNASSGSSTDYFLFSDSDSCSGYNSDQENSNIKEYVLCPSVKKE